MRPWKFARFAVKMANFGARGAVTGIVPKSVKRIIGHVINSTVNLRHHLKKQTGKDNLIFIFFYRGFELEIAKIVVDATTPHYSFQFFRPLFNIMNYVDSMSEQLKYYTLQSFWEIRISRLS